MVSEICPRKDRDIGIPLCDRDTDVVCHHIVCGTIRVCSFEKTSRQVLEQLCDAGNLLCLTSFDRVFGEKRGTGIIALVPFAA